MSRRKKWRDDVRDLGGELLMQREFAFRKTDALDGVVTIWAKASRPAPAIQQSTWPRSMNWLPHRAAPGTQASLPSAHVQFPPLPC